MGYIFPQSFNRYVTCTQGPELWCREEATGTQGQYKHKPNIIQAMNLCIKI